MNTFIHPSIRHSIRLIQQGLLLVLLFVSVIAASVVGASTASAATLTATVDRTQITINDTLLLTVVLDQQGADDIDFSALNLQFDILQRQQSSQTSIVNGRITSRTQWTLIIAPKETGQLIIPSLSANNAFSDAISIQVSDGRGAGSSAGSRLPSDPAQAGNQGSNQTQQQVFLIADVDKDSVYVQEQLLVRLQLHYRIALSQYEPSELVVNGATQEYLDKKNYKKTINGIEYNVLELVYAVHPQASGTVTIPAQRWQVEKPSVRFGLIKSPYLRVSSDALDITVKPVPQASTADHWLPATALTLSQQWEQSTISAKVGEPLSYQLRITADGLSSSQLPDIVLDTINSEDFTVYSDQAETNNQPSLSGITGTRVMNYAIIPKKTGTFTLPPIDFRWWNTTTNREEEITLASQKIVVANTALDQQQSIPNIPSNTINDNNTPNDTAYINVSSPYLWLWQTATWLLFMSSALLFMMWRKAINAHSNNIDHSSRHTKRKQRDVTRVNYQAIETAIDQQAWHQVRTLLLAWASNKTDTTITTTDEFIESFPELAEIMHSLDKQLYSPNAVVVWDTKQLVDMLKKQANSPKKANSSDLLDPLYS